MHYVKQFHINGVDTKQVACIELSSPPNAATEGAVGVLAMDMSSPTHEVYRCVGVNGSIYTWELMSAGMSIISATITGEGGELMSFPYATLLLPTKYLVKIGDLILDSEGYLYQIRTIGVDTCDATYAGTHIGSAGGKTCKLVVNEGKLQLVTENGAVWSSVDFLLSDGNTIYRDPYTGNGIVIGVKTINDTILKFFVGTQEEYDALTTDQKENLFALITDDKTKDGILTEIENLNNGLTSGSIVVKKARQLDVVDLTTVESPDLNNYKTPGWYRFFQESSVSTGLTHAPKHGQASILEVLVYSSNYLIQRFTMFQNEGAFVVYKRSYYKDIGWSAWKKEIDESNINDYIN